MLAKLLGIDSSGHCPPVDLRTSVGEGILLELVRNAVRSITLQVPGFGGTAASQPSPTVMLTLVTYCYAAGIHGSKDIEQACHNDSVVRSICNDEFPDWSAIWRFRNANRPWIEECLARTYAAAGRATRADTDHNLASISQFQGNATAGMLRFAERKVRRAVLTDAETFD